MPSVVQSPEARTQGGIGHSPTVPLCGCIETAYHCSCCCCCWRKQARLAEQIDCARKTVPQTRPCCGGLSRPGLAQHPVAPKDWKELSGSPDREAQPSPILRSSIRQMVPVSSDKGQHRVQVPMLVDRQAKGYSCLLLQLEKGVRGQRECQSGWRGWLSLQLGQLATRRKIASRKLSSAPVPQDLKISTEPAFFPSCLPPRV